MGAEEFMEWYAYEMLNNKDYQDKMYRALELDKQKELSDEERSELIRQMFGGLRGAGK